MDENLNCGCFDALVELSNVKEVEIGSLNDGTQMWSEADLRVKYDPSIANLVVQTQ